MLAANKSQFFNEKTRKSSVSCKEDDYESLKKTMKEHPLSITASWLGEILASALWKQGSQGVEPCVSSSGLGDKNQKIGALI